MDRVVCGSCPGHYDHDLTPECSNSWLPRSGPSKCLSKHTQHIRTARRQPRRWPEICNGSDGAAALHVSQGDAAELAHRLASADQVARHDPRQYIPEDAVAAAFNGLMAQIQDSHATPIQTDAQTVHRIRLVLAGNAPVLTSIKEHPTSCLPEEAVLLTILLTFNNGGVVIVPQGQPLPRAGESFRAESSAENASLRLDQYLDSHRTTANMVLFSKLLQAMGI